MGIENFTTYTEVDPNTRIAVIASKVSWVGLTRNEIAHVYKGHSVTADFEYLFDFEITAKQNFYMAHWVGFSDVIKDAKAIVDDSDTMWGFYTFNNNCRMHIMEDGNFLTSAAAHTLTVGTTYYLTMTGDIDGGVGSKGQLVGKVYSDEARTDLLATLSLDAVSDKIGVDWTPAYLYAANTYNDGGSNTSDGFTENLDLQEGAPPEGVVPYRYYYMQGQGTM